MIFKKSKDFQEYLRVLSPKIINLIEKSNKIADVGCGTGNFLNLLHTEFDKSKKSVFGYDLSPKYIKKAKRKFPHCYQKDFNEKLRMEKKFDLVFTFDVIEHLKNPYLFLSNIKKMLVKKGNLVVTTPNLNSLSFKFQGENWFGFHDKEHKILYTPQSLKYLLEKTGFKLKLLKTSSTTRCKTYNSLISLTDKGGEIVILAQKNE